MKNITIYSLLSLMASLLFFACSKEQNNLASKSANLVEKRSYNIDSSLLLIPQTVAYIGKEDCSIYTSISACITSPQVMLRKLTDDAKHYTLQATTEDINTANKTTFTEYINPDNIDVYSTKYTPTLDELYGKNVIVTGIHDKDANQNFTYSFYLPQAFVLAQQEDKKTIVGKMTNINRKDGYTLEWNKDDKNKQGVLITIYRDLESNTNFAQLGVTAIRYIVIKDEGKYTITAEDLKDMEDGVIRIVLERGCLDYRKVAALKLPVEIFAYHLTEFNAKVVDN